ncbi:MAG: translation initiation factor IF-2 [Candidatus Omnitrophota bacterium]|nr:translation initiation factor IF-2 [Candidatus Omnitrophota bacterium]
MKVADLAKELNTTNDALLEVLRSLKLKAKDSKQELNAAVISVVRSHLRDGKIKLSKDVKESKESKLKGPAEKAKPSPKLEKPKKVSKKIVKQEENVSKKQELEEKAKKVTAEKFAKDVKKVIVKESVKPKTKFSKEPLITLKPLVRKRKKMSTAGKEETRRVFPAPGELKTTFQAPTDWDNQDIVSAPARSTIETPEIASVEEVVLPAIEIQVPISVKDFSVKVQQKPSAVLKKLMDMRILANINQNLDQDIVEKLTKEFGFKLAAIKTQEEQLIEDHVKEDEDPKLLKPRSPVVTLMGHVDHGKTSLLDKIRKSDTADREHGGITQHIGAYSVRLPKGIITFLDTPGHEAFTAMRARGVHITDIVILVIAADEGIMPQTEEAIAHAQAADVPIVVALNKIDHKNADPDKVKKQLMEKGLTPEDWGGKVIVVLVSAVTGEGIDHLLEIILLEAEILELKANYDKRASGIVVEAHLSGSKGAMATLIVQGGTLREGDLIVVGPYYGKVRALLDDRERPIKEAGPSMPVEVLGLSQVPDAGELFYVVEDEKHAKSIVFKRLEKLKNDRLFSQQKLTLEGLYSQIQEGKLKELNVIIKADVQGSLEALRDSLAKIPSNKVKLKIIHMGCGGVNLSDVLLAVASKAIIIAFHVDIDPRAKEELEKQPVDVRQYRIIYDVVNDVKKALEGLLEAKLKKVFQSRVEIREVFKLSKSGIVAGCYVQKGKVHRKDKIDVIRNNEVVYSGALSSLKRFKDDVREVNEGMECGIVIEGFTKIQSGDIIETYEIESIAQKL